ncbi:hypothetical protein EMIHUDRAFT_201489 [Emiliania huxleyi CCMP1516]|nr:hypothetical protein EMIHUDRAFT_201489 [Emiliania huxleyi CCMP1516]EOD35414.1 hypothetical protein EMIHUDRAFT_201489 [Emiliania huxleyi CCMP1516]|eukprot:XP_005787843.1 hypothetical protein EMIHUDRAFT_201489 [Emiliania huxleyi CCMP1516]
MPVAASIGRADADDACVDQDDACVDQENRRHSSQPRLSLPKSPPPPATQPSTQPKWLSERALQLLRDSAAAASKPESDDSECGEPFSEIDETPPAAGAAAAAHAAAPGAESLVDDDEPCSYPLARCAAAAVGSQPGRAVSFALAVAVLGSFLGAIAADRFFGADGAAGSCGDEAHETEPSLWHSLVALPLSGLAAVLGRYSR